MTPFLNKRFLVAAIIGVVGLGLLIGWKGSIIRLPQKNSEGVSEELILITGKVVDWSNGCAADGTSTSRIQTETGQEFEVAWCWGWNGCPVPGPSDPHQVGDVVEVYAPNHASARGNYMSLCGSSDYYLKVLEASSGAAVELN